MANNHRLKLKHLSFMAILCKKCLIEKKSTSNLFHSPTKCCRPPFSSPGCRDVERKMLQNIFATLRARAGGWWCLGGGRGVTCETDCPGLSAWVYIVDWLGLPGPVVMSLGQETSQSVNSTSPATTLQIVSCFAKQREREQSDMWLWLEEEKEKFRWDDKAGKA